MSPLERLAYAGAALGVILLVIAFFLTLAWGQDLKTIPEEEVPSLFCMPLAHYEAIKQDMEELRARNYELERRNCT